MHGAAIDFLPLSVCCSTYYCCNILLYNYIELYIYDLQIDVVCIVTVANDRIYSK